MKTEELFSNLATKAIQVVLDDEPLDWEERLAELDRQIRIVEQQMQQIGDVPPESGEEGQNEIDVLRFRNSSLRVSLALAFSELQKTKKDLELEARQRKELEAVVTKFEQRVNRSLRKK